MGPVPQAAGIRVSSSSHDDAVLVQQLTLFDLAHRGNVYQREGNYDVSRKLILQLLTCSLLPRRSLIRCCPPACSALFRSAPSARLRPLRYCPTFKHRHHSQSALRLAYSSRCYTTSLPARASFTPLASAHLPADFFSYNRRPPTRLQHNWKSSSASSSPAPRPTPQRTEQLHKSPKDLRPLSPSATPSSLPPCRWVAPSRTRTFS
jgi:hypothetical protein